MQQSIFHCPIDRGIVREHIVVHTAGHTHTLLLHIDRYPEIKGLLIGPPAQLFR